MKKNIVIGLSLLIVLLNLKSYSKYKNEIVIEAIDIATDVEAPTYTIDFSEEKITNKSVKVLLEFSEEIVECEGFERLDNNKYERIVDKNENREIEVKDLAGNLCIVKYNIDWIDKEPPIIKGIKNNEVYNSKQIVNYFDNLSGIKDIKKTFYGDLEIGISNYKETEKYVELEISVLRVPKNCNEIFFIKEENGTKEINKGNNKRNTYRIPIDKINDVELYVETESETSSKIKNDNKDLFININNKYQNEDNKTFSNPGNYEIEVEDNAGNKAFYKIQIKKD